MDQIRPPRWAAFLNRVAARTIGADTPGADDGEADGPVAKGRRIPLNIAIDLHKGATGLFVLVLMQAYDVFTAPAWVYLALHGSYGVAWVVKDLAVGDRKWRHRVGVPHVLAVWGFLTLYWVAPWVLILGTAGDLTLEGWTPAHGPWLAAAVVAYVVGLVLMIGADAQKNAILATRGVPSGESGDAGEDDVRGGDPASSPGPGLITTGFFARTRHPNYLGEMLIYGSFALVVGHWLPWLILAAVWGLLFLPNILAIETSLSRYPEYEAWRDRTGFLLPRLRD